MNKLKIYRLYNKSTDELTALMINFVGYTGCISIQKHGIASDGTKDYNISGKLRNNVRQYLKTVCGNLQYDKTGNNTLSVIVNKLRRTFHINALYCNFEYYDTTYKLINITPISDHEVNIYDVLS